MRFDKRSRKIRMKKAGKSSSRLVSFWIYLLIGLALLAFFYLVLYRGHQRQMAQVRSAKIREDMDKICSALALFRQDQGRHPTAAEGLAGLVKNPEAPEDAGKEAEGNAYLNRLPLDPWGSPYVYASPAGQDGFTLTCWGEDRRPGGEGEASDTVRDGCKVANLP